MSSTTSLSKTSYIDKQADFLLVVPPFGGVDRPSLGASIVADIARRQGASAQVVYGNLDFAMTLGVKTYQTLCHTPTGLLVGEQVFGGCWEPGGADTFGTDVDSLATRDATAAELRRVFPEHPAPLPHLQQLARQWVDDFASALVDSHAALIGFTSVFEQTLAALCLARRVRSLSPNKVLVMGGANVDGPLAEGVAQRADGAMDYIFSGEAEHSFPNFMEEFVAGSRHTVRETVAIIRAPGPMVDLDDQPLPDFDDFFTQFEATIARSSEGRDLSDKLWLPYETSRGCWWGQKHHCTFCGLNAEGMAFRSKSSQKVLRDLDSLHTRHVRDRVLMVDNIMPYQYFTTLLPQLALAKSKLHIFYEQKANLSWRRMKLLSDAGVWRIQPGIEALDSRLLAHMDKGVTATQNIKCLRYARAIGLDVAWNLLADFPADESDWYASTTELLPLLNHLQPPSGVSPLSIDRFSPYFDRPEKYGIKRVEPIPAYSLAYREEKRVHEVAYHFHGDYESAFRSSPDLVQRLEAGVEEWRQAWVGDAKPLLHVFPLAEARYLLIDTRPTAPSNAQVIDRIHAGQALGGTVDPMASAGRLAAAQDWALEGGYAIQIDGGVVPLATASRECLDDMGVR